MTLMQLNKTIEQFLQEDMGEVVSLEEFKEMYFPIYQMANEHLYLYLAEGICKIPVKEKTVYVSKIALLTDEDVAVFENIIEEYELLVELAQFIVEEHSANPEIPPAQITIAEFKEQMMRASDDNDNFMFDDIDFCPEESSYPITDFEVSDSYIDAAFIHLKDGWVTVPIAEKYTYGTWYECECTVLTKENIHAIEEKLQKSIERNYIEQRELKALRYMFACIQTA